MRMWIKPSVKDSMNVSDTALTGAECRWWEEVTMTGKPKRGQRQRGHKYQHQNNATSRKTMTIFSLLFPKSSIRFLTIDLCSLETSYHPASFLSGASFEVHVKASGPEIWMRGGYLPPAFWLGLCMWVISQLILTVMFGIFYNGNSCWR